MTSKDSNKTMLKIVECAIALFNEHGYEGTSISDISKKTEMSRGILYHYFKDKDKLYLHCVAQCIEEFRKHTREHESPNHGENAVIERLKYQQEFFINNPQYRLLWYNTVVQKPPHLAEELTLLRKELKEEMISYFTEDIKDVSLGRGINQDDAMNFFAIMQNNSIYALESLSDDSPLESRGEMLVRLVHIFMNGLQSDL